LKQAERIPAAVFQFELNEADQILFCAAGYEWQQWLSIKGLPDSPPKRHTFWPTEHKQRARFD